jgi:HTH-type transcriptional regulator/antitoxin MqsA
MNMKCPACGAAELVRDTRDVPYIYKGESTIIRGVTGDFCPACGEVVMEMAEGIRNSAEMLAFNKQVNASIVDPNFIASVRKKLALDQREAAEIFGGGVNASRTRLANQPPLALVKLFKVLDRLPIYSTKSGRRNQRSPNAWLHTRAGVADGTPAPAATRQHGRSPSQRNAVCQ